MYDPATTKDLINLSSSDSNSSTTRSNTFKLTKSRPNLQKYKFFFTNRIINLWNSLPERVVSAPSMNSFKNQIDIQLNEYKFITNFNVYYTNNY